jgi:phosphoribosyl 1,2-cyclic phosphodiesterase
MYFMKEPFAVKFWGVRGSYPVTGASVLRFGGNTPSVEIEVGGQTVVMDAGTGIIGLGRELVRRAKRESKPVNATIFFSHMHHDHTQGIPFFEPLRDPASHLSVVAPAYLAENANTTISAVMSPPAFPIRWRSMPAVKTLYAMRTDQAVVLGDPKQAVELRDANDPHLDPYGDVQVRALYSAAHPGGVFFYRVDWRGRSVVYASDTEGSDRADPALVEFARDADVLIHDAQYTGEHYSGNADGLTATRGWGHSTPEMACAVAEAAHVGQLILFHHEPTYDDDKLAEVERRARTQFCSTRVAYEGLEIALEPQPLFEMQT